MPVFESTSHLFDKAYDLYAEGKYQAAALVWAQARQAALTLGYRGEAFRMGFWEAEATMLAGDASKARDMLFLLLSEVPQDAPAFEQWSANTGAFALQGQLRPEIAVLERHLAELERLAQRLPVATGDLPFVRGNLAEAQGCWAEALRHHAQAWRDQNGWGYTKHMFAFKAGLSALRLSRQEEARSWLQHLAATDQGRFEEARQHLRALRILLALFDGDRSAIAESLEAGASWPGFDLRGHLFRRAASFDPLDDPADKSHPARKLAQFERKQDVHERYVNLLALTDYRLACLRFTAGLPAVDDLYYQQPDVIPSKLTVADPAKLECQLRHFRFSWHLLRRHARRIDALLECDWRSREVASRWDRAEAIAAAVSAKPTSRKRKS